MTLVNIYAPNSGQVIFLDNVLSVLQDFPSGLVVMGEDFNVRLDPKLDSSSGRSTLTGYARKHIARSLRDLWAG